MRKLKHDVLSLLARGLAADRARREEAEARAAGREGPIGRFREALAAALHQRRKTEIAAALGVQPNTVYCWSTFRAMPTPGLIEGITTKLQELT